MSLPWPWQGVTLPSETVLAKEAKDSSYLLWKSPRLFNRNGRGIAVRTKWQSGTCAGDAQAAAVKGNRLTGNGR